MVDSVLFGHRLTFICKARHLYTINKVRLLYDRSQTTARLVVRNKDDLVTPLDMTHCYLRAMSPIHLKCKLPICDFVLIADIVLDLGNMGVRASMSVVSSLHLIIKTRPDTNSLSWLLGLYGAS